MERGQSLVCYIYIRINCLRCPLQILYIINLDVVKGCVLLPLLQCIPALAQGAHLSGKCRT